MQTLKWVDCFNHQKELQTEIWPASRKGLSGQSQLLAEEAREENPGHKREKAVSTSKR